MISLSVAILAMSLSQKAAPTVEDVQYVANAYGNCLHYNAIRSHENGADAEALVFMARPKCRVERTIWHVMLEMNSEALDPKTTKAEIDVAFDVLEQRYVKSVIATITPIIETANLSD